MQRGEGAKLRGALCAAAACASLILAAGCGSSGSSPSSSSPSASASSPGGTTATSPTSSTSSGSGGGLKATGTPKYASPSPSEPVQSGVVQIAYRNIAIDPDTVRVKVGTTIRWTNYDPVEHNVTSVSGPARFASANFGQGKSFRVALSRAGLLHYLCTIHPTSMNGTIEVVG
jgi:plastocyanin